MTEAAETADQHLSGSVAATQPRGLRWRYFQDRLARYVVVSGGFGVIAALMLIFFYLLSEVLPLFGGAELEQRASFALPSVAREAGDAQASQPTLYVAAEEQGEVGMQLIANGQVNFFDLANGAPRASLALPLVQASIVEVTEVSASQARLAALLSDGRVLQFEHDYQISYPSDQRLITPKLNLPYGETPLAFAEQPVRGLVLRDESSAMVMAAIAESGEVLVKRFEKTESLFGDVEISAGAVTRFLPPITADLLLLEPLMSWLYVIDRQAGVIAMYQLQSDGPPTLIEQQQVGARIQAASYLAGGISIVVAQSDGQVSQWFVARNASGEPYLARVRDFKLRGAAEVTAIGPEQRRRTFAVGDQSGRVSLFYATSGAQLASEQIMDRPIQLLAFNPRANSMLAVDDQGQAISYAVHNEHPEISWRSLWGRVWYESYDEPRFLWQSSAASADFEPKFSLTPLSFGTLKAAFYAMVFAVPIAVLGAIFTANFMAPAMRQAVKPTVELMGALPTVILGFLAGLWLAPFMESNLLGVFLGMVRMPASIPSFGYRWVKTPERVRNAVPAGWEAALLIPVVIGVIWFSFAIATPIEAVVFGGNLQSWMDQELGIGYDQRNALVVGIAMGIAVIPNIYSIAEDAIFGVPKHLVVGSLALGATPWQTLLGVVLPTASPGIFSAIMIGMGRAVGETMIVLMATGNTAVMDPSMFQGLRTLSANIAVEMPESEVGSTHFRLLFLAGLVLFLFTFFFNTLAEVVRQRLREKYSTI